MTHSRPTGNGAADNPFSTRFIDPDRHPFIFPSGESLAKLAQQLAENCFWGEIIGPHGSGKSTLLQDLFLQTKATQNHPQLFFFNDQRRKLPIRQLITSAANIIFVDGAEQLSAGSLWLLKQWCRLRGCGLVITAHQSLGLPLLYRTGPATVDTVRRVVEALAEAPEVPPVDEARHLIEQYQGNLRLILFALYDRWEDRR